MRAFILTLQRLVDRRLNAFYLARDLRAQGFDVEEFPATDYQDRSFRQIRWTTDAPHPMTAGELACAWSHLRVAHQIVETGKPAFVVEDDALLGSPLAGVDVSAIPEFLSLSCWDPRDPQNVFTTIRPGPVANVVRGLPFGTQCYYLTPKGAKVVIEHGIPVRRPSDVLFKWLSSQGLLVTHLAREPFAVQHPVIASYIGQR